ncbi:MAG: hypothetical protein C4586_07140 [Anaerolineaceae bacterium]|nr:MAG: hypothetical protein C4586_07140 [Anaerolineaceae bacterium]
MGHGRLSVVIIAMKTKGEWLARQVPVGTGKYKPTNLFQTAIHPVRNTTPISQHELIKIFQTAWHIKVLDIFTVVSRIVQLISS